MAHSLKENPKKSASFLSLFFLSWLNKLLYLGRKRTLTGDDLYILLEEDQTLKIVNEIENCWSEELLNSARSGRSPRLLRALFKTFSLKLRCFLITLRFLSTFASLSLAILVWHFLKLLNEGSHIDYSSAIPYMVGITMAGLIKTFSEQHFSYQASLKGMRLKVGIIGLVYKKSISCRHSDIAKFSTGHILNLVSNDAQRMEEAVQGSVMALNAPVEILATIALMWIYIGWQSLSGVIYFIVLLIYNLLASKEFSILRYKVARYTDKRLAALNNVICGIRAVKMYAWEWSFYDLVKRLRSMEIKYIRFRSLIVASFVASYNTASPAATLISVVTLLYSGIQLFSFSIFTLVILLNLARFAITVGLSAVLRHITDGYVAVKRVEQFLTSLPDSNPVDNIQNHANSFVNKSAFRDNIGIEIQNGVRKTYGKALPMILRVESWRKSQPLLLSVANLNTSTQDKSVPEHLKMENVTISWGGLHGKSVLQGISLSFSAGQLVMIGGAVGSGKSSLLMAILGEIPLKTGVISGCGRIAYVSQVPWIFSWTIRENILFGKPFNQERFSKVIEVCDLKTDLNNFAKGDLSLIGQRGVSLSGGQRARVSLARALYVDADIFLLDDPLSAVDARVGKKIFEGCICGILKEKLTILVTHQLQYLRRADEIVLLKDGKIEYKGPYDQLQNTQTLVKNFEIKLEEKSHVPIQEEEKVHLEQIPAMIEKESVPQDMEDDDEDNAAGSVTWKTYWSFFTAGSPAIMVVLLVSFNLIAQVSLVAPNWWLSRIASMPQQQQKNHVVLGVFGGLIAAAIILSVTRAFANILSIIRSSQKIHDKMAKAILKSPVLFMDRNPVGRIMNRFSKDTGCVDESLPHKFAWTVTLCLNFAGVMILSAFVNFWMVVAIAPIVVIFLFICRFNLKTSRELKRLEAVRCSPMYAHIADTINGLVVIRSSKKQKDFMEQFIRYQDEHTRAFHLVLSVKQWLGLHLDLLCVVFITCVGVGALLVTRETALTGLVITYAIEIIGETWYGIAMYSDVENQMTSAERVLVYTKLPSEPGYSRKSQPPRGWPTQGAIGIQGLSFSYYEGGPRVLKDVNFEVPPQQKIGIAGRTGAGKSSLVAALFRMPDPQGKVLIDGVDLGTLDIQAARRAMAVITQDPVLFAASLRKNLDPFDTFDNQAIWTALEEVQLKDKIKELKGGLDFALGESGMSFSVGERQLLCLARALLQRSKILIMDEATANVDFMTDSLIQQVIREKFSDCTVLTIAHRLNTIMDYDKVLVLDQGHVVEYDTPRVLAGKTNGVFAKLVQNHSNQEQGYGALKSK